MEPNEDQEDWQFGGARMFTVDTVRWTARIAGEGGAGTGEFANGVLVVILFHREDEERATRFAYLPRGRLEHLYEDELRRLFEEASAVREPESEPPGTRPDTRRRADGTVR
jgi:hypothetical protein